MLTTAILWLLVVTVAIQCGYAFYFFSRFFGSTPLAAGVQSRPEPVSVVICARNEALNLKKNLPAILQQIYTNDAGKNLYEVIVVNDASDDDTEKLLYEMEQEYSHLWHITIAPDDERNLPGKKFALHHGVAYATYHRLLFTDADCRPASRHWLAAMVAPINEGKQIVCGFGGYDRRPGLLNAFIRWETLHTFLQMAGYARAGKPYMAVGRNLACTKEIFLRAENSEAWSAVPSGDDDLLMACCAEEANTAVVAVPEAHTFSEAKLTWTSWLHQKQRHLSTGKYYKEEIKLLLALYAGTHALGWVIYPVLMISGAWPVALSLWGLRCAVYWVLQMAAAKKLSEKHLSPWLPFCDAGWAIYNFVLSPYIFLKNKRQWK